MEKNKVLTLKVEDDKGERLDVFLAANIPEISRSYAQKLIKENRVVVDGKAAKSKTKTCRNMTITVDIPAPEPLSVSQQEIPLDIVYEDNDIIVINKSRDMVIHPAPGNRDETLVNALLYHCGDSLSDINGVIRPGIVHRLDKDTTGLLVAAKNNEAHRALSKQLNDHSMQRIYEAIVHGVIDNDNGIIDAPIGRHPVNRKKMAVVPEKGKRAITHFEVLARMKSATHVRCRLETGRTHQIRVHMAYIHHPVYGDPLYGKKTADYNLNVQMLHSRYLALKHPATGEPMEFEAPLPDDFRQLLERLNNQG
ncbi:MAG TPA: RNA pseudouridine synthase [Ruminiclostridium sp.]|nr:RluA family pseudouridine synthase [Clostridiaceae bacterium]HAA24649.1 RNA pseudouridine synthase [Ruminiclostridium sp.]